MRIVSTVAEPVTDRRGGRFIAAGRLVRALLAGHHGVFAVAVTGAAVFAGFTVLSSVVVGKVTDDVLRPRFEDGSVGVGTVAAVLGALIAVGLVRACGVVVRRSFAGKTNWRAADTLTGAVVDRFVAQPASWHRRQSTGDLITRAGVDAEAATAVLGPLPMASGVLVLLVLSSIWLVTTDLVLGAAAVCVFPVLIVLNVAYQRRVDRHFAVAQHEIGVLSAAVHESFDGVHVVKAFGAERRETDRLATIAARLRQARIETVHLRSVFEALLDGLPTMVNIGLVIGGAYRIRSGEMTVGQLLSFIYLFTLMVFPLRLIGYTLSELPRSQAGFARIRSLLDQPIEPDPAAALVRSPNNGVELRDVSVGFDDQRLVLVGVTAQIAAGRTVAVVGATGSGKTTLLGAIAGLMPIATGQITVPQAMTAIVFQEPFLLAGTIRDNVLLDLVVDEATLEAALAAAEALFVHDLPDGLDTMLGERGAGLSGGQRQRIALARALVRRPALLLLDDTTSALDPATEARVLANLRSTLQGTTVIAVASRPSTIALADEVLYLDEGRVVAYGAHDALLVDHGGYAQLMRAFEHDRDSFTDDELSIDPTAANRVPRAARTTTPGTLP